jgi:hypothetical protein
VFGQIDDIGVAFTGRKFFKLQVVVTIGVVGKFDYATMRGIGFTEAAGPVDAG